MAPQRCRALGRLPLWPLLAAPPPAWMAREIQAAYLYQFAGFVEWPEGAFAGPASPLQRGLAGADALAAQLGQTAAGRRLNGRAVMRRRVLPGAALAGLHVRFAGALDRAGTAGQRLPLLIVADSEQAYALGSMVNLVVADERLHFEVALGRAVAARLRISARMLSAACRVRREGL